MTFRGQSTSSIIVVLRLVDRLDFQSETGKVGYTCFRQK